MRPGRWLWELRRRRAEFAPAGHYYSPIPDRKALAASDHWARVPEALPGVDLALDAQLATARRLADLARPDWERADPARRYAYANDFFSYGDAIALHGMLRVEPPARVVEVGSGFSSAVMLDTFDQGGRRDVALTCVEPYPERLLALMRPGDRVEVVAEPVQGVPLAVFEALGPGDVLFVDSSHVAKAGSDVNHLFFEVLPRLRAGVRVHVHDVFYPFEYPREWVVEGRRSFNEAYLLRAFLALNPAFRIELWMDCLARLRPQALAEALGAAWPLVSRNPGGSIWLRRAA